MTAVAAELGGFSEASGGSCLCECNDRLVSCFSTYQQRHGFVCIPINVVGTNKRPIVPRWTQSSQEDNTNALLRTDKPVGIALVTGRRSGLVVVDIDTSDCGLDWYMRHSVNYPAIVTPTVRTQNGGLHLYFRRDERSKVLRNRTRVITENEKLIGVDVRADGGCVIAPPTINRLTQRSYSFVDGLSLDDVPLAEIPEWLLLSITSAADGRGRGGIQPQRALRKNRTVERDTEQHKRRRIDKNCNASLANEGNDNKPGVSSSGSVEPNDRILQRCQVITKRLPVAHARDYSHWLRVGMALHQEGQGAPAFLEEWVRFSARAEDVFNEQSCRDKWNTFVLRAEGNLSMATIARECDDDKKRPLERDSSRRARGGTDKKRGRASQQQQQGGGDDDDDGDTERNSNDDNTNVALNNGGGTITPTAHTEAEEVREDESRDCCHEELFTELSSDKDNCLLWTSIDDIVLDLRSSVRSRDEVASTVSDFLKATLAIYRTPAKIAVCKMRDAAKNIVFREVPFHTLADGESGVDIPYIGAIGGVQQSTEDTETELINVQTELTQLTQQAVTVQQRQAAGAILVQRKRDILNRLRRRNAAASVAQSEMTVSLSTLIKRHAVACAFQRVTFRPFGVVPAIEAGVFNTFLGFCAHPDATLALDMPLIAPIIAHIREVWACGNSEWGDYLLSWLAHIVKYPEDKTQICIVLRSQAQGAGKGILINFLIDFVIGRKYGNVVDDYRQFAQHFNALNECTILEVLDEVSTFGPCRKDSAHMKAAITREFQLIERKYLDAVVRPDFMNFILLTNDRWPVGVEGTDRRYFCLDISNNRAGDAAYFRRLRDNHLNANAGQHFMNYLLRWPVEFDRHAIPTTPWKREMKWYGFNQFTRWAVHYIRDRTRGAPISECKEILEEGATVADLYQHFQSSGVSNYKQEGLCQSEFAAQLSGAMLCTESVCTGDRFIGRYSAIVAALISFIHRTTKEDVEALYEFCVLTAGFCNR